LIKKLTVKNYYDGVAGGASLDEVQLTEMVFEDNGRCGVLFNSSNNPVGNKVDHSLMFANDNYGVYIYQAGNVTVEYNTIHDDANYGVYVNGAPASNYIHNNCFYNHPGVEGYDNNTIYNWTGNFFDDYSGSGYYYLDGGTGIVDLAPNTFTNTAASSTATWEVFSVHTVDFNWGAAACNPQENGLAAYSFTVSWDITKLQYQPGSANNTDFMGSEALYTPPIDSSSVGKLIFSAANFTSPAFGSGKLAYAAFKPLVTGGATITLSSQYQDMDNNPLPTVDVPLALTLTDTQKPIVTNVTPNNPIGDNTYSDPVGTPIQLKVMVSATDNYQLTSLWYRFDGAGGWIYLGPASGTAYTTPAQILVNISALLEGNHVLNVIASDGVNLSDPVNYNFKIDRTGPVLTSITLIDADGCAPDAQYTNDRNVTVDFVDDGTRTKMEFYLTGWEGSIAAVDPATYQLPSVDGPYTLYARLYDAYGNMGNQVSDAITLDRVAPIPTGWTLAGGAAKTNIVAITGAVAGYGSGAYRLNHSESAGDLICGNGGWVALANPVNVTLSAGDGVKTVYYATMDRAGNISAVLNDQITLDATAPVIAPMVVTDASDGEQDCTDNWTVDVTVGYVATDVVWLGLSTTSGTGYTWYNISAATSPVTQSYTIAGGSCDANNTIYAVLVDDINNYSTEGSDGIFVDCSVPTAGTMALDNGATFSPDVTVDVTLTGMSSDIIEVIMSPISGDYSGSSWVPFDPLNPTVTYAFSSPAEAIWVPLYLKARDCAGRESGEVTDNIVFDLTDPIINTMTINSGAVKTNNPNVTITYTWTDVYPDQIMLSENAAFTGASWQAHAPSGSVAFVLSAGDGTKTVYMKMKDLAGHVSAVVSDAIILDQTLPTGAFTILSGNPSAASGYTNNLANNSLVNITYSGDAVSMRFKNFGGVYTSWIPVAGTYPSPWTLAGPAGVNTVQVQFRDDALNTGGPYDATIIYDVAAPSATPSASGIPGGSLKLGWTAVPGAYKYFIRYTFWNDYPNYAGAMPPHPLTLSEGLSAGSVTAPTVDFTFAGPQPDIYAISIWTMDSAGNYSGPNTDVLETNYILGDIDFNGEVEFGEEFGAFAGAYYRCDPQDGFDPQFDIGPTDDGSGTGYPIPDDCINFEDLVPFAMNYDAHGAAKGNSGPAKIAPVLIMAQLPDQMTAGSEYTISISNDNPSIIKGFHLVFNYDRDNLEIVNVKQGKMFETSHQTFFFNRAEGKELLLDGIIFGAGAQFKETEMAQVTIRAIHSITSVDLEDMVLTVRDIDNKDVPTSFSTTVVKGVTPAIPTVFALSQNYPNPFNPTTTIELALPVASDYLLDIYNVVGQKIKSFSGYSEAGIVTINWNASDAASGVYFYKVKAGDFTATKKMMLVK